MITLPRQFRVRTTANVRAARVEAADPDVRSVARSITDLSGFETKGFGTSDLLIAANAVGPSDRDSARWSDFRITPLVGSIVARGAPLELLWENYEPSSTDGKMRLRYSVSVQRETDKGLVAVASRLLGTVRGAVTRAQRNDQLIVSYDRELPAQSVLVDGLRVDVGRLEPGRYRVSLTVTDLPSNRTVSRVQRFTIAK